MYNKEVTQPMPEQENNSNQNASEEPKWKRSYDDWMLHMDYNLKMLRTQTETRFNCLFVLTAVLFAIVGFLLALVAF